MTTQNLRRSSRTARRADRQGARVGVTSQAPSFEKLATDKHQRSNLTKLMKPKQLIHISTFNVRTLNGHSQLPELVSASIEQNVEIICLQEHRFFHEEEVKHHQLEQGWVLITASAWKNSMNSTIGGTGILLSPRAYLCLTSIEKITPRILIATFDGNPVTTIVT